MTQQAFERGDWQTVIDAHPLESHDPAEWLRYGVALLQTLTPGAEAIREPRLAVHLHLQQHHRLLRRAGLPASGPKRPIKTMVRRFELRRLKAIERIPRSIGPQGLSLSGSLRQQQGDQVRGALEQPEEPVIGFQNPPSDTGQPSVSPSLHSTYLLLRKASVVSRRSQSSAYGGHQSPRQLHHRLHRSPPPYGVVGPAQFR